MRILFAILIIFSLFDLIVLQAEESTTLINTEKIVKYKLNDAVSLESGEPVVVALSKVGEKRWGFHQFSALARLPDGSIQLSYSHNEDAVKAYGTAAPTLYSLDEGNTWKRLSKSNPLMAKPHPSIFKVANGEYLCVPPPKPFNLKTAGVKMSKPFAHTDKGQLELHRFKDCPKVVQKYISEVEAMRKLPEAKSWKAEKISFDTNDLLVFKYAKGPDVKYIPRTWFEHSPVKVGKELFYADYRTKYMKKNGKPDLYWTSVCMVSVDKGKTWTRRGTIAFGTKTTPTYEPMIGRTSDGGLICVVRTSPGTSSSKLQITSSKDAGKTWTPRKTLNKFGAFPGVLLLENGVLVASYGRPGIHFKFSLDGRGQDWTKQYSLIPAKGKWNELSCGYTSLLPLNKSEFLIAYSDFKHKDKNGKIRKAILVRRVKIKFD